MHIATAQAPLFALAAVNLNDAKRGVRAVMVDADEAQKKQ
jgi:hypothetical protein